jgi:hypothetical protein
MLADLVLIAHFAFVTFVVAGFALVLAGGTLGWQWVRNRAFRLTHLAAIAVVAAENVLGIACPLTVIEARLRGDAAPASFIGQWVSRVLYYDLPPAVFTVAYVVFAVVVAVTLRLVPPRAPGKHLSA